ncbi:hypothetical protein OROMI_013432 [Orobanche minor]
MFGQTSWSFAGLGFLSLYLAGKIRAFYRKGHVAKLCIVYLPLLTAALVGVSRVDDYRHHWQDVFVGGLLGWGPYAHFDALDEMRSSSLPSPQANGFEMHVMQFQIAGNSKTVPLGTNSSSTPSDVESGRM